KYTARKAPHPLGIPPLAVLAEQSLGPRVHPKQRVDRRQAADPSAVAVTPAPLEETVGIAVLHRPQHLPVLPIDRAQPGGTHRPRVTEAPPHVSEVSAGDEGDAAT